jgi:hypothetical protein
MACDLANGTCVQCLDNTSCSGLTPVCDTAAVGANAHRCVVCLPPAPGSDAGPQGCDGGPGQMMCAAGVGGGFVCR